jgi:hypothetical protein
MSRRVATMLLSAVSLLTACSYPVASVTTVAAHPMLRIFGAPPSANLLVDAQPAGLAASYGEGGRALVIPHGTHRIEVVDGATTLYSSDVYFGDDATKTIAITPRIQ